MQQQWLLCCSCSRVLLASSSYSSDDREQLKAQFWPQQTVCHGFVSTMYMHAQHKTHTLRPMISRDGSKTLFNQDLWSLEISFHSLCEIYGYLDVTCSILLTECVQCCWTRCCVREVSHCFSSPIRTSLLLQMIFDSVDKEHHDKRISLLAAAPRYGDYDGRE